MSDESTAEATESAEATTTTEADKSASSTSEKPKPPEGEKTTDSFDPERALEKIRNLNSEAKNLRERAKAAEAKAAGADEKDAAIVALQRQLVAAKTGLPDELVERLVGSTPEELQEDAEKLLALVTPRPGTNKKPSETVRTVPSADVDTEETDPHKLAIAAKKRAGW